MKITDIAYQSGKKRQSPRTGLIHGSNLLSDTVPLYDNFCYAYALLSQRKAAEILEAKNLLLRILAFQSEDGNFPIALHDFPKAYDQYMGLRIAPILIRSLKSYGGVIGAECKEKLELALQQILDHYNNKSLPLLWEHRYKACLGLSPETLDVSPAQTWDYWVSEQLIETPTCNFYHRELGVAPSLLAPQDHFEPEPQLIEWACAVACDSLTPRLQKDHPNQVHLAALDKVDLIEPATGSFLQASPFRFFWGTGVLHSLILVADQFVVGPNSIAIDLPLQFEFSRDDLFEVSFFCDASPDVKIEIAGDRGTSFTLGEVVRISTLTFACNLTFELLSGEGDFCGRIFRSNRPSQIACTGPLQYEVFDWKIGLRTLRRSANCQIRVNYTIENQP